MQCKRFIKTVHYNAKTTLHCNTVQFHAAEKRYHTVIQCTALYAILNTFHFIFSHDIFSAFLHFK